MEKEEKARSLPKLQKTLERQIEEIAHRADVRKSENMIMNCYAQSIAVGKLDKEIASMKEEVISTTRDLLRNADDDACASLLSAYGEISR